MAGLEYVPFVASVAPRSQPVCDSETLTQQGFDAICRNVAAFRRVIQKIAQYFSSTPSEKKKKTFYKNHPGQLMGPLRHLRQTPSFPRFPLVGAGFAVARNLRHLCASCDSSFFKQGRIDLYASARSVCPSHAIRMQKDRERRV